jgi:hypothetical protein
MNLHLRHLVLFLFGACLLAPMLLAAETHLFTDTSGRTLEGEVTEVKDDSVTIRRKDGQKFTLEVSRFSEQDRTFIRAAEDKFKAEALLVKDLWSKSAFTIHTISLASGPVATWILFNKDGNHELSPKDGKEVVEYFKKQPDSRRKSGILIFSSSYAVPDTPEERAILTAYQLKTWKIPEWLKSQAALIDDLKRECALEGIPLYVNTSGNLKNPWLTLVPAK